MVTRKLPSPMKYQQFAFVEATFASGILDNMRYDRACPFEEVDAHVLEQFLTSPGVFRRIKILITRWTEDKKSLWTEARWKSSTIQLTPLNDDWRECGDVLYSFQRELEPFPKVKGE